MKTKFYELYLRDRNGMRGKNVKSFKFYKDLKAEAIRRTVAAGYPKSGCWDLFDWSQG